MLDICFYRARIIDIIAKQLRRLTVMRTASIFKNGKNQAIRLPKEFEFDGVTEVEIRRDGESLILTPKRKSWTSFSEVPVADDDFLIDRPDAIEEGRV